MKNKAIQYYKKRKKSKGTTFKLERPIYKLDENEKLVITGYEDISKKINSENYTNLNKIFEKLNNGEPLDSTILGKPKTSKFAGNLVENEIDEQVKLHEWNLETINKYKLPKNNTPSETIEQIQKIHEKNIERIKNETQKKQPEQPEQPEQPNEPNNN